MKSYKKNFILTWNALYIYIILSTSTNPLTIGCKTKYIHSPLKIGLQIDYKSTLSTIFHYCKLFFQAESFEKNTKRNKHGTATTLYLSCSTI